MNSPVIELLARLVACPSVNPAGKETFAPPYGEERMSQLLAEIVTPWGAGVSIEEAAPGRPNFLARFRGKDSSRCLLLEAHSDTVQIDDMTIPPFEPSVREGRLYGRGSCDTKAALAAMLAAMREILDTDGRPPTDVLLGSSCNEEYGARGIQAMVKSGLGVDAAVVGEPTRLMPVHAHKGVIRWRIATHGVAAHSSLPEKGVSAISHMAKVIATIDGPLRSELARKSHPLLGAPRISVGTIRGGTQFNIVPSYCVIEVDRRLIPPETAEAAAGEVARLLEEYQREDPTFKFDIEHAMDYPPFYEEPDSPLIGLVQKACRDVGLSGELSAEPYGTNAGFLKTSGISCVVLGPGDAAQAHTVDEFVEIEQVEKAVALYAGIIRGF